MGGVSVISHPVVDRYLTYLRDKNTNTAVFRRAMSNIGIILAYHALNDLKLDETEIETPIQTTTGYQPGQEVVVIPILRAGLSLVDGIINFMPEAKVGHVGVYRDEETHQPVNYYDNLPTGLDKALTLVVDPMLATGNSAVHALNVLRDQGGFEGDRVSLMTLVAAPEGVRRVYEARPDVQVFTASLDERLNDDAYIVPGLGDAGDRIFGTL